jgi:hypothetical protein
MSAELAVQGAIVTALKASSALSAIVGAKVFDRVPAGTSPPYVHVREFQAVEDGSDCADAWEVYADIDVWSDQVGKPQAAHAAAAVRKALHNADLTLADPFGLVGIRHQDTQIGDGGDGLMTRARMTFRALVEEVD